uniref:Uncharacterized protein n=1 Tax=Glossina pallidipes TaxID=7398 RepID=A0A1B0ACX8_GLOPL
MSQRPKNQTFPFHQPDKHIHDCWFVCNTQEEINVGKDRLSKAMAALTLRYGNNFRSNILRDLVNFIRYFLIENLNSCYDGLLDESTTLAEPPNDLRTCGVVFGFEESTCKRSSSALFISSVSFSDEQLGCDCNTKWGLFILLRADLGVCPVRFLCLRLERRNFSNFDAGSFAVICCKSVANLLTALSTTSTSAVDV